MITIDEGINRLINDAVQERELYDDGESAEEYEQIIAWLKELKNYRDKNKMVIRIDALNIPTVIERIKESYQQGNYDAFDECFRKFCEYDLEHYGEWLKEQCDEAEEQLKEHKE